MTGNKAYLVEYQDFNGGPVAFGGSKGQITRKGIKREYINVRTPQKNGVAKRKNKTLIKAARTMLANSFLPNTFWAEAVSTACYVLNRPVTAENKANKTAGPKEANNSVGTQDNINAGNSNKEAEHAQEYFVLPLWSSYTSTIKSSKANNGDEKLIGDAGSKTHEEPVNQEDQAFLKKLKRQEKEADDVAKTLRKTFAKSTEGLLLQAGDAKASSTNYVNTTSVPVNTASHLRNVSAVGPSYPDLSTYNNQDDSQIPSLEDIYAVPNDGIFTSASYDDDGVVADFTNLESTINVSPIPQSRIYYIHPTTQILRDPTSAVQTRSKVNKSSGAHACFEPKKISQALKDERKSHKMDVKSAFLYGKIDEEVHVSQPLGFIDPKFLKKVYKVVNALYGLHQASRAWYAILSTFLVKNRYKRGLIDKTLFIKNDKKDIMLVQVYVNEIIFGSTKKSWCDEFEALMKNRFQMSSMGELTFFIGLRVKQREDGIFISQDKYVAEILQKFDFISVKTTSTPIKTQKPLVKDAEAVDVDIHLYRSTKSHHPVLLWGDFNKQEEKLRRNLNDDMRSILGNFFQNQPSTSGTLPSNIVTNPKGEMKSVTTRSGLAYEGPSIPTYSPLEKVDEQNTEEIMEKEHSNCPGSTAQVQPLVVPISILKPDVLRTQPKHTIPYLSRLNDQKLRKKATNQMKKFCQIFNDLHFDISFTDALLLMPKFASTIKSLPANKDKLFELAKVPLNENCSTMLLKKLLEKLGDPADPRVPLILGRSFLRTGRALIGVYREEITLRVNDESITFNLNQTMRYSSTYDDNFVNRVDVIDIACEDFVQEVLDFQYNPKSSNPTLVSDPLNSDSDVSKELNVKSSSPTLTPFIETEETKAKSSVEEPPELELKQLPSHLVYACLEDSNKLPVIIAKDLKDVEKEALINVLKSYKQAIAWKIFDIKGYFQIPIDPQDQEKTTFTCPYGTFVYHRMPFGLCNALGHKILKSGIEVDKAKVDVIVKLSHPTTVKDKETPFVFSKECIDAFNTLKKKLTEAPILVVLHWNLPFELMCDASDFTIGAVLGQHKTKHFQPIHYASKTMTEAQIHYTTTEKEMFVVVYAFEKFRPYLVLSKSIVYTDHSALKYLLNKQDAKPRGHHGANLTAKKGIDFMGPFPSSKGNKYILVAVNYLSKWVEAKMLPTSNARVVVKLLKSLFSQFGIPQAIISDRGTHFSNDQFTRVIIKYRVTHRLATAYHPQTSGQVEVSNRGLKRILERTTAGDHRKLQLNELSELRDQAYENSVIYKDRTKKLHDSKIKNRIFNVGDQVLLFNYRLKIFSGKLKTCWSGPFTITQVFPYGTIELSQPNGPNFKVNGHRVKHYFIGDIPSNVSSDLHTLPMDN
nr:hypothetical protein [Tanacetum cinerariifolium]